MFLYPYIFISFISFFFPFLLCGYCEGAYAYADKPYNFKKRAHISKM